jgi:hypothetical protein
MELLGCRSCSLGLDCGDCLLQFLCTLLRQFLLDRSLLGLGTSLVFLIKFLVLCDLLLELGQGGLEGRLLQDLRLLVGIDLAARY